ncbi:hypothetical protein JXA80_06510 [bacterium]|nr:hypothetical protein [candidate division CSSED10-310 bacterium]
MTSFLMRLGFPAPEKRDSVHFYFARKMAYDTRMTVAVVLLGLGLLFQTWTLTPWPGIPFLIMSVGLILVKGYDSRARLKHFSPDTNWTAVDTGQLDQIESLRKQSQKWDSDALDITNTKGCMVFLLMAGIIAGLTVLTAMLTQDLMITAIVPIDAAIYLLPLWFTGMRFILTQPNLIIKVRLIKKLSAQFESIRKDNETFVPALMLTRDSTGNSVPIDARFTIRMDPASPGFYGLQAQININLVQGHSYPYFYCVLAAKPGFGLNQYAPLIPQNDKIICEYQEDRQAEVLVIRQFTTKTSGYHTKDDRCWEIMWMAVQGTRSILGA